MKEVNVLEFKECILKLFEGHIDIALEGIFHEDYREEEELYNLIKKRILAFFRHYENGLKKAKKDTGATPEPS